MGDLPEINDKVNFSYIDVPGGEVHEGIVLGTELRYPPYTIRVLRTDTQNVVWLRPDEIVP